jgi:hypothetical protein
MVGRVGLGCDCFAGIGQGDAGRNNPGQGIDACKPAGAVAHCGAMGCQGVCVGKGGIGRTSARRKGNARIG